MIKLETLLHLKQVEATQISKLLHLKTLNSIRQRAQSKVQKQRKVMRGRTSHHYNRKINQERKITIRRIIVLQI